MLVLDQSPRFLVFVDWPLRSAWFLDKDGQSPLGYLEYVPDLSLS